MSLTRKQPLLSFLFLFCCLPVPLPPAFFCHNSSYVTTSRCTRSFRLKELSKWQDLTIRDRLFHRKAPEKAILVLNMSILIDASVLLLAFQLSYPHPCVLQSLQTVEFWKLGATLCTSRSLSFSLSLSLCLCVCLSVCISLAHSLSPPPSRHRHCQNICLYCHHEIKTHKRSHFPAKIGVTTTTAQLRLWNVSFKIHVDFKYCKLQAYSKQLTFNTINVSPS